MMRLFKVTTRFTPPAIGIDCSQSYVVAEDPNKAYKMVRAFFDKEDIGFIHNRELKSVELIAEDSKYPEIGTRLFL